MLLLDTLIHFHPLLYDLVIEKNEIHKWYIQLEKIG